MVICLPDNFSIVVFRLIQVKGGGGASGGGDPSWEGNLKLLLELG